MDQGVEGSHGKSQSGLQVFPLSMHDFFEMKDRGHHGKNRFDDHSAVPSSSFTNFDIFGEAIFVSETGDH